MNFYSIFTLLIGFIVVCRWKGKMGIFLLFLLFVLAAFRGEKVGHDTIKYMNISYIASWAEEASISSFSFDDLGTKVEILSGLMYKTIATFKLNTRFVLVFYAFVMMLFLYLACRKFKVNVAYTIAFFVFFGFFFYSLSASRQFCAISVILYAMSFLQDNEKKRNLFWVWLIVAVFIHSFSIICFFLYYVNKLPRYNKKIGLIMFVLSLFVVIKKIDFLEKVSLLLNVNHISYYMNLYGDYQEFSMVRLMGYWIEISCLYYFFYRKKKLDFNLISIDNGEYKYDKKYQLYTVDYIYLFSMFIYAFLFSYDGLIGRVRYNFAIIQCVYLASYFMRKPLNMRSIDMLFFTMLFLLRIAKNSAFVNSLESNYYIAF